MTRTEILISMHAEEPLRIFRTMQIGGSMKQLNAMKDEGLISSEARYRGGHPQRNWYLSDEQHAALSFLLASTWTPGDTMPNPQVGYEPDLVKRHIPHSEALEVAQRLINSCARVGIPARADYDDDLLIKAYIHQQIKRDEVWKESTDSLIENQDKARAFDAAGEKQRLIDRIADLIGLPKDEELDQVTFELWFSGIAELRAALKATLPALRAFYGESPYRAPLDDAERLLSDT